MGANIVVMTDTERKVTGELGIKDTSELFVGLPNGSEIQVNKMVAVDLKSKNTKIQEHFSAAMITINQNIADLTNIITANAGTNTSNLIGVVEATSTQIEVATNNLIDLVGDMGTSISDDNITMLNSVASKLRDLIHASDDSGLNALVGDVAVSINNRIRTLDTTRVYDGGALPGVTPLHDIPELLALINNSDSTTTDDNNKDFKEIMGAIETLRGDMVTKLQELIANRGTETVDSTNSNSLGSVMRDSVLDMLSSFYDDYSERLEALVVAKGQIDKRGVLKKIAL